MAIETVRYLALAAGVAPPGGSADPGSGAGSRRSAAPS